MSIFPDLAKIFEKSDIFTFLYNALTENKFADDVTISKIPTRFLATGCILSNEEWSSL
jgi:hypothetical protein